MFSLLENTTRRKKWKGIERDLCHVFIARKHNKKEEMERNRKGTIPYFIAIKHNKKEEMEREIRKGIYALYTLNFFPENYTTRREEMEGK
jgi:hypothetical protein